VAPTALFEFFASLVPASESDYLFFEVAGTPDGGAYTNYFGAICGSNPYDWCSEWGFGSRFLGLMPSSNGRESWAGSGTAPSGTAITVRVGSSRAAACGF
jgi:hypothetical protein